MSKQQLLMFLIDTNVISEARKGRRADPGVQSFWIAAARDDHPQAQLLEEWLVDVLKTYGDRVLHLDSDAAQIWGRLRVPNPHNAIDKQIAAIALLHDLTVVTRNTDDFAGCGARLLNPFQAP
jgi:Predicted nucleic acid-binding protein, contains PIN domain